MPEKPKAAQTPVPNPPQSPPAGDTRGGNLLPNISENTTKASAQRNSHPHQSCFISPPTYSPTLVETRPCPWLSLSSDCIPCFDASPPSNRTPLPSPHQPSQAAEPARVPPLPTYCFPATSSPPGEYWTPTHPLPPTHHTSSSTPASIPLPLHSLSVNSGPGLTV